MVYNVVYYFEKKILCCGRTLLEIKLLSNLLLLLNIMLNMFILTTVLPCITELLWQCAPDERAWSYSPCGDLLHAGARTWLPGGCYTHRAADTHVWGDRGRHPALSHWTGGTSKLNAIQSLLNFNFWFYIRIWSVLLRNIYLIISDNFFIYSKYYFKEFTYLKIICYN